MIPEVLAWLRCPVCRGELAVDRRSLVCPAAHRFDLARQGYVHLQVGHASSTGDSARMVAARAGFLADGHMAPLAAALAELAAEHAARDGIVLDAGAGSGYYLAAVLERLPDHRGLAVDLSPHAARRAARAHPRAASVVADSRQPMPVAAGAAALVLDVFAPRNPIELRRVLRPDGALLVVTPRPGHLAELRAPLGLIEIEPHKEARLDQALGRAFVRRAALPLRWPLHLDHGAAERLVDMGPSAHHVDRRSLADRLARLPAQLEATGEVRISAWEVAGAPPEAGPRRQRRPAR